MVSPSITYGLCLGRCLIGCDILFKPIGIPGGNSWVLFSYKGGKKLVLLDVPKSVATSLFP
jgi:hypothetical protein